MSDRTDMELSVGALLDGTLAGEAAIRFLSEQDLSQLSPYGLAGAVDAVMKRMKPFPSFPEAIDGCGTGGDNRATYNISTAAAIVVASRGVQVAKHGNRAVSSKSGSADVLEALGVNTLISPDLAWHMLEKIGISFLYAPSFHPGFARLAPIRRAIGKRTLFNLMGPLCNPARIKRQLMGVFKPEYCALVAETAKLLGHTHFMSVHGEDGTDELSITGNTHTALLMDGALSYASIRPQDAGLTPRDGKALIGGDANQNARALRDVLDGIESPYADAVVLNAAAMLMLADRAPSLYEGAQLARVSIARGDARRKLEQLITMSHDDA